MDVPAVVELYPKLTCSKCGSDAVHRTLGKDRGDGSTVFECTICFSMKNVKRAPVPKVPDQLPQALVQAVQAVPAVPDVLFMAVISHPGGDVSWEIRPTARLAYEALKARMNGVPGEAALYRYKLDGGVGSVYG